MTKEVFVLSKTKCPYATLMKKWFSDKKIKITEILIDEITVENHYSDFYSIENLTSPHLVINNTSIGGYMDLIRQESFVKYLLGIENIPEE